MLGILYYKQQVYLCFPTQRKGKQFKDFVKFLVKQIPRVRLTRTELFPKFSHSSRSRFTVRQEFEALTNIWLIVTVSFLLLQEFVVTFCPAALADIKYALWISYFEIL